MTMESLINHIKDYWFWVALVMSLYWGVRSIILFTHKPGTGGIYYLRDRFPHLKVFLVGSYQFIFNFVCSMAGWYCFYVLIVRIDSMRPAFHDLNYIDLFLFIFSLLGMTGHLPQTTIVIMKNMGKLIEKIALPGKK